MATTPIKRRSAAGDVATPKAGARGNSIDFLTSQNNDSKEVTHRRRSHLAELNMQSPYKSSPMKKTSSARDVPATQKLSNDQLSALISATIEGQVKRKINSKTAFDWNLIDYLNEICTTQEDDMPSFSTLANVIDASGEIYASKVDHLLQDTIKVRTDLARTSAGAKSAGTEGDADGDDAVEKKSKRSGRYSGATIVKNVSQITSAKLDLEFSVDPLFRKTSAAFDQGGARGLLMNHLSSQGQSELKFDSSESVDDVVLAQPKISAEIDIAGLLDNVPFLRDDAPAPSICPSFEDFKFMGWSPSVAASDKESATDGAVGMTTPVKNAAPLTVNTEYDATAADMDDDNDNFAFDQSFTGEDDCPTGVDLADEENDEVHTESLASRTRGRKAKLVLQQDNEFGWFDSTCGGANGWHGEADFAIQAKQDKKKAGAKKAKKPKFTIDFKLDRDWKKLLGKSKAATTLAKSTIESTGTHTLPDDLHFTAQSLTRHFLLPDRPAKLVAREYGDDDDDADDLDGDDFQGAAAFGDDAYIPVDIEDNRIDDDSPVPLFDDDGDDSGDDGNSGVTSTSATLAGIHAEGEIKLIKDVKRVQKINIGYAQKAKVMDVKKLKSTLWSEISTTTTAPSAENLPGNNTEESNGTAETRAVETSTTFNQLIADVPRKVDNKMAENLSVPIMFVCLLYLANDKELQISGVNQMDNLIIKQKE